MKKLNCADAGFDCKAVVYAETEDEVMSQAAEHAFTVHGASLTPEMAEQVKMLITEE